MPHSLDIVLLAAGKGTRMKSTVPKVLHRICGNTLIERAVVVASTLAPQRLVVVVGDGAKQVEENIDALRPHLQTKIFTALQAEQRGTGHAVQQALPALSENSTQVLIVPGDVPLLTPTTLQSFVDYARSNNHTVCCLTAQHPQPESYGRIVRNKEGNVVKIVEHKDCTGEELAIREVNSSVYLVDADFLRRALAKLTNNNAQGEFYLTDIVELASASNEKCGAFCLENFIELSGANTRAELAALEHVLQQSINQRHMLNGVTIQDPFNTYIDDTVSICQDAYIGAGTQLRGATQIGAGVQIEGNAHIQDSIVEADSLIRYGSVLNQAHVGERCNVGPFAHLRPETKLEQQAKVGNFVEIKKSTVSAGAKVNHLTYIGDAFIGQSANIGAGTITCNYDGVSKHKTEIGEGAFIGSNASLVAPVVIGARAVVGAGSTITKDVPADSLGIGRAKQTIVPNWSERKKK